MWTAAVDPAVLTVTARPGGASPFDVSNYAHMLVVDALGHEHIAITAPAPLLRLDVIGGTLRKGPVALIIHVEAAPSALFKLAALDRLLRLIGLADRGRRSTAADPRLARLAEALRVADAVGRGASLFEVARLLAGDETQTIDWPGDGEYRKSATRRRVALARRLLTADPAEILSGRI